ncbi:aldo/keto reductase [Planctomycetaceae bacterium SH139]
MQIKQLGDAGFAVSQIGLGCWQFGGDFGPIDDETSLQIMQSAVDQGISFFDTANVYGDGRSERLIGQFRAKSDAELKIATKFGRGDVYPDGYSLDALRQAIDASRERLGVDCIDLLQLHCVPTAVLRQGAIFDWLRTVQQEGSISHWGASVESDEEAVICLDQPGLLSLQMIFNIFRQKPLEAVFPRAADQGVGIIVRLPLASGLLAGKYTAATTFAPSDHRNFNRDGEHFSVGETFAGLPFQQGVALVESLRDWLPPELTMAQMAQRWILDYPAVSTIITGASRPEQVLGNAAVADLPALPAELHRQLAEFYHREVRQHIRGPY